MGDEKAGGYAEGLWSSIESILESREATGWIQWEAFLAGRSETPIVRSVCPQCWSRNLFAPTPVQGGFTVECNHCKTSYHVSIPLG